MESIRPGRRQSGDISVQQSSALGQMYQFCQPCSEDGQQIQAQGFCSDCQEYLCKDCYGFHSKVKLTKSHVLLELLQDGTLPTVDSDKDVGDKITDPCPAHADKVMEYHCKTHRKIACTTCVMLDHRNCQEVKYIPDIAKGIADSQECKDLQKQLCEITDNLNDIEIQACRSFEQLKDDGAAYTLSTQQYRDELVEIIDKLVAEAEQRKQAYIDSTTDRLNNVRRMGKAHLEILEAVQGDIDARLQAERENSLFVLLRQAETLINECRKTISIVENDLNVKTCEFEKDTKLYRLLTEVDTLGKLLTVQYPYLCDEINIKAFSEMYSYDVNASLVLPDGRLIVTDFKNESVKLFDANQTLKSRIVLQSVPYDIAAVRRDEIVVSMPGRKSMQFISVSDVLTPGRVIETDIPFRSVAHRDGKLIAVKYTGEELVELSMNGNRVNTILRCPPGYLEFVKVHPDHDKLYVSGGHNVGCFTMRGELLGKYRDENLKYPHGIDIHEDGSVYVCGKDSNNVHHLTADCKKIDVLLSQGQVVRPYCICFHPSEPNKMYIAEEEKKRMKVFKLRG